MIGRNVVRLKDYGTLLPDVYEVLQHEPEVTVLRLVASELPLVFTYDTHVFGNTHTLLPTDND